MRRRALPLLALNIVQIVLAGCSGIRTSTFALEPRPNRCQVTEARPSAFSTTTAVVCWGATGEVIGFGSTGGQPGVAVPLAILGAGATVIGAGILTYGVLQGTKTLSTIKATGSVGGSVGGSVDLPVSVKPGAVEGAAKQAGSLKVAP